MAEVAMVACKERMHVVFKGILHFMNSMFFPSFLRRDASFKILLFNFQFSFNYDLRKSGKRDFEWSNDRPRSTLKKCTIRLTCNPRLFTFTLRTWNLHPHSKKISNNNIIVLTCCFFFFTAGYIFYGWHKNIPFIITVLVHRRYIMHEGKNGIPPETLF